jgi:hypothetical protein
MRLCRQVDLLWVPARAGLVVMLGALVAGGCAPAAERIAEGAAPAGIESSLEALKEEENRRRFVALMEEGGEAAASGALRGIRAEVEQQLEEGEPGEWLAGLVERVVRESASALREELAEVGPEVREVLRDSLGEAMDEMLTAQRREQSAAFVDAMVRSAMVAMIETGTAGLREEVGPALEDVVKEHIAPGRRFTSEAETRGRVETLAEPEMQAAAAEAAWNESQARVAGAHDALVERGVLLPQPEAVLGEARSVLRSLMIISVSAFLVLALLVVGSALLLGILLLRLRRRADAPAGPDRRGRILAEAVREARDRPWGAELEEIVHRRFEGEEAEDPLPPRPRWREHRGAGDGGDGA